MMNIWKILFLFFYNRLKTLQQIEFNPRIKGVVDEMDYVLKDPKNAEDFATRYNKWLEAQPSKTDL